MLPDSFVQLQECAFAESSRRCVKGKLFHYTVDNSSLRRRIRLKSFHEATKKSQKLGDNHIHGRGFFVSELSQPLAVDDFIALSNHRIGNIFSNNDFGQSKFLPVQFAQ